MSPDEAIAPRVVGPVKQTTLTGKVFPWINDRPVVLGMPGTNVRYLPCFTFIPDLHTIMERCQITGYVVKHIDDGPTFQGSLISSDGQGNPLHVILDPYFTPEGTIKFDQVVGRD